MAVERKPECISLIKKPAEKVQLMAVLRNPQYIASIKEPAEKVQLAAVQKAPEYIRYIEEPAKKVQHMAVQGNPGVFRYIKSPSETVQLAAVQARGENIGYVSAPSEIMQFAAVRENPGNVRFIEEPTEKVQLFVLHTDRKAAQLIRHPSEEVKRQAEEMYGVKLEGAAEVKNETETEAGTAKSKGKDNAAANENASAQMKSRETQRPSAKSVKAATEKLDGEIKDINMEYDKTVREIRQKEDAGSRQSALRSAGANRDRQLAKAVGQFSESSTSGKKGYDIENIIKDLRKEGVKVENMQATEWNALLKGKSISSSAGSTTRKAATKSRALMLSKTPVGYTLKAIGTTNRMSRQASADM